MKNCEIEISSTNRSNYDNIIIASKPDNRCCRNTGEESPSSIGQGCWLTTSGGDSKESATEIYR